MAISQDKWQQLEERMQQLGIVDNDLTEKFIMGSGKGGQKVNKTSSCVYLRHAPSGIEIKCQRDRSREMNRYLARRELCDQIEEHVLHEKSKKQQLIEKIRRQKRRRTRRQQEKMLEGKRIQGEKKSLRQTPPKE